MGPTGWPGKGLVGCKPADDVPGDPRDVVLVPVVRQRAAPAYGPYREDPPSVQVLHETSREVPELVDRLDRILEIAEPKLEGWEP